MSSPSGVKGAQSSRHTQQGSRPGTDRKYGAALKSLNIYFRSILSVSVPDIRVGEAGGGATESGGEKRTKVKGETSPLDEKRVHG